MAFENPISECLHLQLVGESDVFWIENMGLNISSVKSVLLAWRILLVVLAMLVAWEILASGITGYYLQLTKEGDTEAARKLVVTSPLQPEALYGKALEILEKDPTGATAMLKRAYAGNPSAAAPLLALAGIAQQSGDHEQAAALIEKAAQIRPSDSNIQRSAGNYWAAQGNLDAAMKHWTRALEASPRASTELFPILLKLAEQPHARAVFVPLAASPPSWWERFFAETARRALDLETVRTLYGYRRTAHRTPITREERNIYIQRLMKDGKVPEAYLTWVNGLDKAELSYLGILNNGSFELEPTSAGFDWHLQRTGHVIAATDTTAGVEGAKALHLMFRQREKPFRHVYQPLFLDPGTYRVRGNVRVDSLDSKGGLKWVVRCLTPEPSDLGESERMLGSSQWRDFSFEIKVPDACTAQEIRLVSAGTRDFEHFANGGIWFDRMSMRKIAGPETGMASSSPGKGPASQQETGISTEQPGSILGVVGDRGFSLQPSVRRSLGNSDGANRSGAHGGEE